MRGLFLTEVSPARRGAVVVVMAAVAAAVGWTAGPAAALSVAAAGLALMLLRRRGPSEASPARLHLCERRALGNGAELWLVEVDGRPVLVACGRGCVALRPLRAGASQ